jgi:hypothetical protein
MGAKWWWRCIGGGGGDALSGFDNIYICLCRGHRFLQNVGDASVLVAESVTWSTFHSEDSVFWIDLWTSLLSGNSYSMRENSVCTYVCTHSQARTSIYPCSVLWYFSQCKCDAKSSRWLSCYPVTFHRRHGGMSNNAYEKCFSFVYTRTASPALNLATSILNMAADFL